MTFDAGTNSREERGVQTLQEEISIRDEGFPRRQQAEKKYTRELKVKLTFPMGSFLDGQQLLCQGWGHIRHTL